MREDHGEMPQKDAFFKERHHGLAESLKAPWEMTSVIYGGEPTVGLGIVDDGVFYLIAVEVDPSVLVETPDGQGFTPGEGKENLSQSVPVQGPKEELFIPATSIGKTH